MEIEKRIRALKPLLSKLRRRNPKTFVLTNDEVFVARKPHRHLVGVTGNLDQSVLSRYPYQIVTLEYGWGKLDVGPGRWSYLLDLGSDGPHAFGKELLGMSMNPICYTFFFAKASLELAKVVSLMSGALSEVGSETGALRTALWERKLLNAIGVILYPREETFLDVRTADDSISREIRAAFPSPRHDVQ